MPRIQVSSLWEKHAALLCEFRASSHRYEARGQRNLLSGQIVQTHLNWRTPGASGLERTLFHVSAGPPTHLVAPRLLSTGLIIDSLFLWIKLCFNWWLPLPRCLQKKPGNLHSLCVLRYSCVWRPDGILKCLPQPSQFSFETRSLAEPRAH